MKIQKGIPYVSIALILALVILFAAALGLSKR